MSQHLQVLREALLVRVRAEGARRIYTVDPDGVHVAQRWLAQVAAPFEAFAQLLDAIATEVARGTRTRSPSSAHRSPAHVVPGARD